MRSDNFLTVRAIWSCLGNILHANIFGWIFLSNIMKRVLVLKSKLHVPHKSSTSANIVGTYGYQKKKKKIKICTTFKPYPIIILLWVFYGNEKMG